MAVYNSDMLPISVFYKAATESTMDDAREAVLLGHGHGTLCIALRQNSGRGRLSGRKWEDGGEGALLFTLVIHEDKCRITYPLTQLLALSVCNWLENRHELQPQIKWPNDVCFSKAKIAGILVEKEGPFFLAGIGINLWQTSFPETFRQPATSLTLLKGIHRSNLPSFFRDSELYALLAEIERNLGLSPPIEEISRRLMGIGAEMKLHLGDPAQKEELRGNALGLQADGALLIKMKSGKTVAVHSGEIREVEVT